MAKDIFEVSGKKAIDAVETDPLYFLKIGHQSTLGGLPSSANQKRALKDPLAQINKDLERASVIFIDNKTVYSQQKNDVILRKIRSDISNKQANLKQPKKEFMTQKQKKRLSVQEDIIELSEQMIHKFKFSIRNDPGLTDEDRAALKIKIKSAEKGILEAEQSIGAINTEVTEKIQGEIKVLEEQEKLLLDLISQSKNEAIEKFTNIENKDNRLEKDQIESIEKSLLELQQGLSAEAISLVQKNYRLASYSIDPAFMFDQSQNEITYRRNGNNFGITLKICSYSAQDPASGCRIAINSEGRNEVINADDTRSESDLKKAGYKPLCTITTTANIDNTSGTPESTFRVEVESTNKELKYVGPKIGKDKAIIEQTIGGGFLNTLQSYTRSIKIPAAVPHESKKGPEKPRKSTW